MLCTLYSILTLIDKGLFTITCIGNLKELLCTILTCYILLQASVCRGVVQPDDHLPQQGDHRGRRHHIRGRAHRRRRPPEAEVVKL